MYVCRKIPINKYLYIYKVLGNAQHCDRKLRREFQENAKENSRTINGYFRSHPIDREHRKADSRIWQSYFKNSPGTSLCISTRQQNCM